MHLITAILLFTLQTFIVGGNQTSSDTECIVTDIKSHLTIASQIIEAAMEKMPKGAIDESRNQTSTSYKCIFTDIKSHLRIASQIIETAKQKVPQVLPDLEGLCKEFIGNKCKNITVIEKPIDCSDIYLSGERRDGIYSIWPRNETFKGPLRVYCDMESNGGGWTVFQRRGDYGSPKYYFYKDWDAYKIGFGNMTKDFWIGNDNLFALTNQRLYQLRVNLTAWDGESVYAVYENFSISDELQKYTLHVSGYNGTAGDNLERHNLQKFTTKDRKNDRWSDGNCAVLYEGAWWYNNCMSSSLNGLYYNENEASGAHGVIWLSFKNGHSMKDSVMKIRPAGFTDTSNRHY